VDVGLKLTLTKEREKGFLLAAISIALCLFGSSGSAIFWILGATLSVVVAHATFASPVQENFFEKKKLGRTCLKSTKSPKILRRTTR